MTTYEHVITFSKLPKFISNRFESHGDVYLSQMEKQFKMSFVPRIYISITITLFHNLKTLPNIETNSLNCKQKKLHQKIKQS